MAAASVAKATPGKSNEFKDIDMPKKKKGIVKWIIVIVVVLALVGSIVSVLVFNVFNIRDNFLVEPLSNIPIIGGIVSPMSSEAGAVFLSREELELQIEDYRLQIAQMETELASLNATNINQVFEINRLLDIEARQNQFTQMQEEFDWMIAEGDVRAFLAFYEQINPQRQAEIYRELRGNIIIDDQMLDLVRLYESMNTRSATEALEAMIGPNTSLVLQILEGLSLSTRASIMQTMSNDNRVTITNLLAPTN